LNWEFFGGRIRRFVWGAREMTTKEKIVAEIGALSDRDLDELHGIIHEFIESRVQSSPTTLMERLRRVRIVGPTDFSANLDMYMTGEKRAG
jgi:hypothetical protein